MNSLLIAFVAYTVQVRGSPIPPRTAKVLPAGQHEVTPTVSLSPIADLAPLRRTSDAEAFGPPCGRLSLSIDVQA